MNEQEKVIQVALGLITVCKNCRKPLSETFNPPVICYDCYLKKLLGK